MNEPLVIKVNHKDEVLGFMPKMQAHEEGVLHRAISVLIFNTNGDWLLQQRAIDKYHCGGQWSNTCCTHPYPYEETIDAAARRLGEEMGMEAPLTKLFHFKYYAELDNGLCEHELDHLYFGISDDFPIINKDEVESWRYISDIELREELELNPEKFTAWFKIIYKRIMGDFVSLEQLLAQCA